MKSSNHIILENEDKNGVVETTEVKNELENSMTKLAGLVSKNVDFLESTGDYYRNIAKAILDFLSLPDGDISSEKAKDIPIILTKMEHKDLLKLLDICQKAQTTPIGEFTKLVSSMANFYDTRKIDEKVEALRKTVEALREGEKEHYDYYDYDEALGDVPYEPDDEEELEQEDFDIEDLFEELDQELENK